MPSSLLLLLLLLLLSPPPPLLLLPTLTFFPALLFGEKFRRIRRRIETASSGR